MTPPPAVPPLRVAKPVSLYSELAPELPDEELEDEELLEEELLEDELEDDPLEEELDELDDEELLEDELEELEEELLEDELEPPLAGAKVAMESASWLELAAQLFVTVPVLADDLLELAPPLPETALLQRTVWPVPAVKVALEAPLVTASTSQEFAVATVTLAEIAVPEVAVAVLMPAVAGAPCTTPVSETEPAATSLTAPPKVTATECDPAAGLSR
jgi:hypothetical protein